MNLFRHETLDNEEWTDAECEDHRRRMEAKKIEDAVGDAHSKWALALMFAIILVSGGGCSLIGLGL